MYRSVAHGLLVIAALTAGHPETRAQATCETERPPAERAADCLEFAGRRFRIPVGYFVPWYEPDGAGKMKLVYPAGKTEFSYFVVGAKLPDMGPVAELADVRKQADFRPPAATEESEKHGILAVVNLAKNLRVATRIEPLGADWVFAETLPQLLAAHGCSADGKPNEPLTLRCNANNDTFRLFRRDGRTTHFTLDAPGSEGYVCVVPYSQDIYLSVSVTDDARGEICEAGFRLRDKLRGFEY